MMSCPECAALQKQFLEMRRAVLAFAHTLNQFEDRRLAEVDANRPHGAPSIRELRKLMEREAGLA